MSRKKAFEKDAPADWKPAFGEKVWLRRLRGQMSVLVATGFITGVADDLVAVRIEYGRRNFSRSFLLTDVRPIRTRRKA